jgi:hypothetical protein
MRVWLLGVVMPGREEGKMGRHCNTLRGVVKASVGGATSYSRPERELTIAHHF